MVAQVIVFSCVDGFSIVAARMRVMAIAFKMESRTSAQLCNHGERNS